MSSSSSSGTPFPCPPFELKPRIHLELTKLDGSACYITANLALTPPNFPVGYPPQLPSYEMESLNSGFEDAVMSTVLDSNGCVESWHLVITLKSPHSGTRDLRLTLADETPNGEYCTWDNDDFDCGICQAEISTAP